MLRFIGDFSQLARFGFFMYRNPQKGQQKLIWCNGEQYDPEEDDCVSVEPNGAMSFEYTDSDAVALLVFDLTVAGLLRKI